MKLLKTIHKLIEEAEDNFYEASLRSDSEVELCQLEKRLEDSLKLLDIFS